MIKVKYYREAHLRNLSEEEYVELAEDIQKLGEKGLTYIYKGINDDIWFFDRKLEDLGLPNDFIEKNIDGFEIEIEDVDEDYFEDFNTIEAILVDGIDCEEEIIINKIKFVPITI